MRSAIAAGLGEAATGGVNENATHGVGGNGEEMAAILDVPAAFMEVTNPNLVDEFRGGKGKIRALAAELA